MLRVLLALGVVLVLAGCGSAAHGVPQGFRAETGAAFGPSDLWILGQGNTLVRSTDGGAHFEQVSSPPLRTAGNGPILLFASASEGFAYIGYGSGSLYATHDGGDSWSASLRAVVSVAVGGGHVFALTRNHGLERSSLGGDTWTELPGAHANDTSLAVGGSSVWLLGPPRRGLDGLTIQISSDSGRTFASYRGPCLFDLRGRLVPAGVSVVWAVCPTGMMAGLSRSTDAGRSFPYIRSFHEPARTKLPSLTNGAQIFPLSRDAAVLYGGPAGPLYRTADGGKEWVAGAREPWAQANEPVWLGFPAARAGWALSATRLWRTTDDGASWRAVPIH